MRTLHFPKSSSPKFLSLTFAFLFAVTMLFTPAKAQARVFISVGIAPPVFPVNAYYQPLCPGDGYIWTPGYYSYMDDGGYVWVPGAWVMAPYIGALWTPGYWGFGEGYYHWHRGYWGRSVGYYGGFNYGNGYYGRGYEGGRWNHGGFYYNRNVNNINIHNTRNVYEGPRGNFSHGNFNSGMRGGYNNGGHGGPGNMIQSRSMAQSNARPNNSFAQQRGGYANNQIPMHNNYQSRAYAPNNFGGGQRSFNSAPQRSFGGGGSSFHGSAQPRSFGGGGGGGFHGGGGGHGGGGHEGGHR